MTTTSSPPVLPEAPPRRAAEDLQPAIEVRHLTKTFGGAAAVSDLSFSIGPGRVTGFLGPNGAGKTTTLRVLLGLTRATSGAATFGTKAYAELPRPQQLVGAVLEPGFHPARSARNHLRIAAATAEADDARVDDLLALVGLEQAARRPVRGFSLGMRQRLALAEALVGDPQYLILDEPANGLDPDGIRWLRRFLRDFAATGRVVLVSSHMLGEMQATADDVVVIAGGRLLVQAPVSELAVGDSLCRVRVPDPAASLAVLTAQGFQVQQYADGTGPLLRVTAADPATVGHALFAAGIAVLELAREEQNLEARFFELLAARA